MFFNILKNSYVISIAVEWNFKNPKIKPKGSMYKENKIGPKRDPCGIPQAMIAEEDEEFPIKKEKDLSEI